MNNNDDGKWTWKEWLLRLVYLYLVVYFGAWLVDWLFN